MLPIILKYKLRQAINSFTYGSPQRKLGWLISIAFLIPFFVMLTRAMSQIYTAVYNAFGWQYLVQLVNMNLAIIFFFVLISTASLTLYRIFQAKDLPLLMSLPTPDRSLFEAKLAESLSDTGRNMILPFPVCLALASLLIRIGSPFDVVIFFIGWAGVLLQLASLSIIIALVLGKAIAATRWTGSLRIIAVISAMAFLTIFMGYYYRADSGATVMPEKNFVFFFLPTSWLIGTLGGNDTPIWTRILYGFGFMLMTAGCPAATFYIFGRRFRRIWMMTMEVKPRGKPLLRDATPAYAGAEPQKRARVKYSGRMGQACEKLVRGRSPLKPFCSSFFQKLEASAPRIVRALIFKEVRVTRREPHIWIGLIFPLVLFPMFMLFKIQSQSTQAFYMLFVSLLTTITYVMPCLGREGRSFALLRSLPIRVSAVLRAKFLLGCAVNLTVTFLFVIVSYLVQHQPLNQVWYNAAIAIVTSVYFSAFGTALAAIFPKFDFTNPMKAVSIPALITLYLIATVFGLTLSLAISSALYLTPLVLIIWFRTGQAKLERMDF